ncbi:chaperone protein DnaJ, partial [Trifolium medium]|nr:chaperone protein DnaJ [Trifolium medium]
MIAKIDVYISAENKVKGEADWYGILGVDPRADDDTVRKHYRKLALMLHPDKNKSVGADGA